MKNILVLVGIAMCLYACSDNSNKTPSIKEVAETAQNADYNAAVAQDQSESLEQKIKDLEEKTEALERFKSDVKSCGNQSDYDSMRSCLSIAGS